MALNPEIVAAFRCPKSGVPLVEYGGLLVSTDEATRLAYPVRDGIPVLIVDEAETLPVSQWQDVINANGETKETGEATNL